MHCELCEICASKDEEVHIYEPLFGMLMTTCSNRNKGCPGFVPGNIPKKVVE